MLCAACAEPSREPLSSTSTSVANGRLRALAGDRVQAPQQQLALGGVDHAEGQLDRRRGRAPAYCLGPCAYMSSTPRPTPRLRPRAVCGARPGAGREVELFTSRFAYGAVAPRGRRLSSGSEFFYRARPGGRPGRGCALALQARRARARHAALPPRRPARGRRALPVAHRPAPRPPSAPAAAREVPVDRAPLVLTAHDVLPREPRPGQLTAQRRLYERFDAVVVHSEHGRLRLIGELGIDPAARPRDPPRGASPTWPQMHPLHRSRPRHRIDALATDHAPERRRRGGQPWCCASG